MQYWKTQQFDWTWVIGADTTYLPPSPVPRMRMCVDGVPVSEWQEPVAGSYTFKMNVQNGHHIAHPELEGIEHRVCARDFVVNDTGSPLPAQEPWAATNRYDMNYSKMGNCAVQMRYPGALPKPTARPMKPRAAAPVTARLSRAQMWGRSPVSVAYAKNIRRYFEYPTGDVGIEAEHKYHLHEATTYTVASQMPTITVRSGPRYVGALGFVVDMRIRPGLTNGTLFLETNAAQGRLGLVRADGSIVKICGIELGAGNLKGAGAVMRGHQFLYAGTPEGQRAIEHYNSKWTHTAGDVVDGVSVGNDDWSQVVGPNGLQDPWGFAVAMRLKDGSITYDDGHEFWIADTLNHRIVFADHWTAHPFNPFQKAHFPPIGYVQAEGVTGHTTMANFVGSLNGQPTEYCNEPWKCRFGPDGKLYWTNYAGNSIYRCNIDGTGIEPVLVDPNQWSLAQLKCPMRLHGSTMTQAEMRALVVDGPPGVASIIRPTSIDFFSDGSIGWIEDFTFAIRKLDKATGLVKTLGYLEGAGNVPNMVIDSAGAWGAIDDIFCNAWYNNTDKRYDKNGAYIGRWSFVGGSQMTNNGDGNVSMSSAFYGWGFDVRYGKLVTTGNASGNQYMEYTAKLPTDPKFDLNKWATGAYVWEKSGFLPLIHGPLACGELGAKNAEDFAAMTDDELRAALAGMSDVDAVIYYLRWNAREFGAA